MEAPEKIYLQEPTKVRTEKKYDNDVEYIHTNAFIDKACGFIETYPHLFKGVLRSEVIKDFKNYMKGE